MEHWYYQLMFTKSVGEYVARFCVYVELNDQDGDLLGADFSETKVKAIVHRAGILDYLPRSLDPDWPLHGKIMDPGSRKSWELGVKPTKINQHNVWSIDPDVETPV
jgi:hypothetical protein